MTKKEQQHGGVKLTAKTARTLAMQEFGTARGLTKSTSFVGAYFMEFVSKFARTRLVLLFAWFWPTVRVPA